MLNKQPYGKGMKKKKNMTGEFYACENEQFLDCSSERYITLTEDFFFFWEYLVIFHFFFSRLKDI